MTQERIPFEQMTQAQKQTAFEKWVKGREDRKSTSTNRRKAMRALIEAHQDEYDNLVRSGGRSAQAPKQG